MNCSTTQGSPKLAGFSTTQHLVILQNAAFTTLLLRTLCSLNSPCQLAQARRAQLIWEGFLVGRLLRRRCVPENFASYGTGLCATVTLTNSVLDLLEINLQDEFYFCKCTRLSINNYTTRSYLASSFYHYFPVSI
jgi:hypothetical protein